MALVAADILLLQTVEVNSLGGAIGVTPVPQGVDLFFDNVAEAEAETGSVAYRCVYVKNQSVTDTLYAANIYIATRTPNPSTSCQLALDAAGLNGTAAIIADESVAPPGAVFEGAGSSNPLQMGDLGPGDYYPVWIERTVAPNAVGSASDYVVLAVAGDWL